MHTYNGIADEKPTGKRLAKEDGEIHDAATGDNNNKDDDDNRIMYRAVTNFSSRRVNEKSSWGTKFF